MTHISIVSISLSLGALWNGLSFPARAEAVSLPSGTTPVNEHASSPMSESGAKQPFGERSLNPLLRAKRSLPNAGHEAPLSSGPRLSRAQTAASTLSPFTIF
jgi:hypothetical protein